MEIKKLTRAGIVFPSPAILSCAQRPGTHHMGGNWGHMMNFGYGGIFMWIIVLAIIGAGVYFLIHASKSKGANHLIQETPLDILKKRYARGEIDKEEFDRKKANLE